VLLPEIGCGSLKLLHLLKNRADPAEGIRVSKSASERTEPGATIPAVLLMIPNPLPLVIENADYELGWQF